MPEDKPGRRLSLMDYMAIVAGIINLVVIGYIVGYWFLHSKDGVRETGIGSQVSWARSLSEK